MQPKVSIAAFITLILLHYRARDYGELFGMDDSWIFTVIKIILGIAVALILENMLRPDRGGRRSFVFLFVAVVLFCIRTWDYCDLFGTRDPSLFIISKFILGFAAMSVFAYEKWKASVQEK